MRLQPVFPWSWAEGLKRNSEVTDQLFLASCNDGFGERVNKAAVLHELPASRCQLVHKVIVQERVSATGEPTFCY